MRCPTCQRAHIYHFCSFCMRCHICHFPIAIWSQNLGTGTIFEPNLPFKTGCNKFQMESVKKKKEAPRPLFVISIYYVEIVKPLSHVQRNHGPPAVLHYEEAGPLHFIAIVALHTVYKQTVSHQACTNRINRHGFSSLIILL